MSKFPLEVLMSNNCSFVVVTKFNLNLRNYEKFSIFMGTSESNLFIEFLLMVDLKQ